MNHPIVTTKNVTAEQFIPRSYHVLLVQRDTPEGHMVISSPDTLILKASYLHAITKEVRHTRVFRLSGPITLHLMKADRFPGWFYICQWSEGLQRYACSCSEGKSQGFCKHIAGLETWATQVQ